MIKLDNAMNETIEQQPQQTVSDEVSRIFKQESARVLRTDERITPTPQSLKDVLLGLQQQFSNTNDLPETIESLIDNEVSQRTQELYRQAHYDALTHLPNRSYFHHALDRLVHGAQDGESQFTLLFLDLDGFKAVNDNFGHMVGDDLLRNVAARLISAVREDDMVCRLGGDEFVVLLAGLADNEVTEGICERIIFEVARPYWLAKNDVKISTSIGVARFPMDADTPTSLIDHADKALYASKEQGRNQYCFYQMMSVTNAQKIKNVISRFEDDLANGRMKLAFSPQVDMVTQSTTGASVTAIWPALSEGENTLAHWQTELEASTWNDAFAAWLLDSTLFYLQQWQEVQRDIVLSIPVLKGLWERADAVQYICDRFHHYGISTDQVQLEFTAKSMQEGALPVMKELALTDFQLTLSEVGAEPFDFASLAMLELYEMKLSADWIKSSMANRRGQKWLAAFMKMANAMDINVVVTGVDDLETMKLLVAAGPTIGQGTLWTDVMDAVQFSKSLTCQFASVQ